MEAFIMSRLLVLPGILIGLSLHEFAHAFSAYKLGDSTAKDNGRLTIEPTAHIDFFGFLFFILVGFGWAKPVPINPANFKKQKRDEIIVSVAGPIANFLLAIIFAIIFVILVKSQVFVGFKYEEIIYELFKYTVYINILLGILNLLPIPPLDGSKIIYNILPKFLAQKYMKLYEYQIVILLILFLTGALEYILVQPTIYLNNLLLSLIYTIF